MTGVNVGIPCLALMVYSVKLTPRKEVKLLSYKGVFELG